MNNMLKREVYNITTKERYTASFFEDDTIEVVRQQIAKSIDVHPDRLYILVGLRLPLDYYTQDPRNWESLFDRLSYGAEAINKDSFKSYQLEHRTPNTSVAFREYDRIQWMSYPEELKDLFEPTTEFVEYRILGVDPINSFVLPFEQDTPLVSRIPASRLPIPQNMDLFASMYSESETVRFAAKIYDVSMEERSFAYFPLLRATTPNQLSEESIRLMNKNAVMLDALLKMDVPTPTNINIIRAHYYIPFVETDFGSAIRTRFEQIFYGMTVSKKTPYIGLFTSGKQVSRHKFFAEDPQNKTPYLDDSNWKSWWSTSKPQRDRPTLILFRGKSKKDFDKISITSIDISMTSYRSEEGNDSLSDIEKGIEDWLLSLDALVPFLSPNDIQKSRWEFQDLSYVARYSKKIEDFNLMRFSCISSIFDIPDKTKNKFNLLRSDTEKGGINPLDAKILQMMREDITVRPEAVAEQLSVPIESATKLIQDVNAKLEENPRLLEKTLKGYPDMHIGPDFVTVRSVDNLERSVKYSNILRFILSNPDSDDLDRVCPKRMERVEAETSIPVVEDLSADLVSEYADIFAYAEGADEEPELVESEEPVKEEPAKISTDTKKSTTYGYFLDRLAKFDPITFNPSGSQYAKKCEKNYQPIILSPEDETRLKPTPYDPKKYMTDDQMLEWTDPAGTVICPEFWCMRDQIPLQESQLIKEGDEVRCPVCNGKLWTKASDDPKEYPLQKRGTGFVYPGTKYESPHNKRMMPCCYKTSQKKKIKKEDAEDQKYYIVGSTKTGLKDYRISFLPDELLNSLKIQEKYEIFKSGPTRILSGMSGFFRSGLGNILDTLPTFLGLKTTIPSPHESVETVLKCSFLRSWKIPGTKHIESISGRLKDVSPFNDDTEARDNVARLISGINEAFENKKLSKIESLEYACLALQCDVFRVHTNINSVGCLFYTAVFRPRSRAIIVLQNGEDIDILCHITRKGREFTYNSNIFQTPFKKETYVQLEKLRLLSCRTEIPSYNYAMSVLPDVLSSIDADDFSIILDPFGRGQAFYVPAKMILPYASSPVPNVGQAKIDGYKDIDNENLPRYADARKYLEIAKNIVAGYEWSEDLYDAQGYRVEILVKCGLRIPVYPEKVATNMEPLEVVQTVRTIGETELVFGKPSEELEEVHRDISYNAEVFDFLLYQLTKDIESDYVELREALLSVKPNTIKVKPLLQKWYNETTQFVNIREPSDFVSKIRKPCGQFKSESECSGNLCGWDGKVCRIKIRNTLNKDSLFHRLLSMLVDNSKIRAMVLDGRTTPFFSTILYLELPHELILTDNEL